MHDKRSVVAHYDAVADGYGAVYDRERIMTAPVYPANYVRLQILTNRLAHLRARKVFEVGVGEATPLIAFARMGLEVAGNDIAGAMVEAARANLVTAGLSPDVVQWGDVEDASTMIDQLRSRPFDAVIASGVLPHVADDEVFLRNVSAFLDPGGTCLIEFRNKLFSLFTFNRHSKEFILDDLLAGVDERVREAVAADLDERLAVDQPPLRTEAPDGAPGYDLIPAKFHNPFELVRLFDDAGFEVRHVLWYHYHPALPFLEAQLGELFRTEALRLDRDPLDWRGHFLCSAGIVEATKR
jgi:2-polyprenyl-3-methyl-5-hydroxy-6-metoxy-1,4-benzoquinol methylase